MFQYRKTMVIGLVALSLVGLDACSRRSRDKAKKSVKDVVAKVNNPELMGTWNERECTSTNYLGNPIKSTRTAYKFSGSEVQRIEEFFSDEQCATSAGKILYKGSYRLGEKAKTGKDVYQLDMDFDQVAVVPTNEAGREILDFLKFCSESNWKSGQEVDLTSQSDDTLCPLTDMPSHSYTMFRVGGPHDSKLLLAKAAEAEESRPKQLEAETVYVKKND